MLNLCLQALFIKNAENLLSIQRASNNLVPLAEKEFIISVK